MCTAGTQRQTRSEATRSNKGCTWFRLGHDDPLMGVGTPSRRSRSRIIIQPSTILSNFLAPPRTPSIVLWFTHEALDRTKTSGDSSFYLAATDSLCGLGPLPVHRLTRYDPARRRNARLPIYVRARNARNQHYLAFVSQAPHKQTLKVSVHIKHFYDALAESDDRSDPTSRHPTRIRSDATGKSSVELLSS